MRVDRTRGDDGVVAVLTALLVATVLLPVAGLGLTAYVRTGVAEEMQRAADAGALAAATSLLFVDTDGLDLRTDGARLVTGPACPAARVSLGDWTPQREAAPLAAAFAPVPVSCRADFSLDDAYPECVSHLVANGQAVLDATAAAAMRVVDALSLQSTAPAAAAPLFGVVQPVLTPVTASATSLTADANSVVRRRIELAQRVFALVPAAQTDGIVVRLGYQVGGPLDGLLGKNGRSSATATSTSRRLFKPLLPSTGSTFDGAVQEHVSPLDPRLAALPALSPVERQVVRELQTLLAATAAQVRAAGGALEGVDDTVAAVTSPDALLRASIRTLRDDLAAAVPGVPAEVLDLMVAEPPPVMRVNPLNPTCQQAAIELLQALARALQLNDDEDDLTSCLTEELLALPGARTAVPRTCIAGLFRAQLRPEGRRLLPPMLPQVVSP